jgi:hypothetical protein
MSTATAGLEGPVTNVEPDFLERLPMDNAVGAILALAAEVYILRERLHALEAELAARRIVPAGAVENRVPAPEEAQAKQQDLAAFTHRILSELARDRVPTSSIHPDVAKYLKTYDELRRERLSPGEGER